ncbi:RNA helicase [Bifidobacterium leontopitheci]|uniref:RNA helicase n=1 Tax=Bifidobacterium leontopitheci TaxID=2650774 RepID=A0A6I1GDD6_9BIFI|nr:RNA helicase [Bifidobacterium leontopitheci]
MFNEGIDIPAVNQIVMLRSTESSIIFTQQLGRGLRKFPHKDSVVVIDFIGNYANNFLIPVALYGNTGDRDIARKNLQRRSIGLSSISFDPIAKERVLKSLDTADWSEMKRLSEQYRQVRYELGRIPMLTDIYEYDPSLPYTLASKRNNYLDFVRSREKSLGGGKKGGISFEDQLDPVSEVEDAILKMATELLLPGIRPHELVILERLCRFADERIDAADASDAGAGTGWQAPGPVGRAELASAIRAGFPQVDLSEAQFDSAVSVLDYSYFTGPNRKRFGEQPLVEIVPGSDDGNGTRYRLSDAFAAMLATNRTFRIFFADTLRVGLRNCRDMVREAAGRQRAFDRAFLYERKYSMADVMRLCGWKKENTPQNVGGYLLDKDTNTMPIFVKYAASQYEDEFLNAQEMKYYSKNGRTPGSPEFQWAASDGGSGPEWNRTHFVPLFVMRKAEEADGKYYYVGHVAAFDHPTLTTKPNAAGDGTVKVTLSTLRLAKPLDPELYRHLTS